MELGLSRWLASLLCIGLRISGLMLLAPLFGSATIPMRMRGLLVFVFTAMLYPAIATPFQITQTFRWPSVVLHELMIGLGLGIAANLVFEAIQMAGQMLSIQMGLSLVTILDPQTQAESTVISLFHHTIAMLIFLSLNVHLALLRVLADSFQYLPVAGLHVGPQFVSVLLRSGSLIFSLGVRIAAPVLAATMVTDFVIGLAGKASPQMPLLLLGPALKSALGAAVLVALVAEWPAQLGERFAASLSLTQHILHLAR